MNFLKLSIIMKTLSKRKFWGKTETKKLHKNIDKDIDFNDNRLVIE